MIPVFFVRKKDGKKWMVQNYYYLNEWTIKNNYSLPLIVKIINIKKVFTKLYLRYKYNNVQIKREYKQNAVFMTPEELFEPTVIFFKLTNSPKMFQTMINEILRDLINTRAIRSFM